MQLESIASESKHTLKKKLVSCELVQNVIRQLRPLSITIIEAQLRVYIPKFAIPHGKYHKRLKQLIKYHT